MMRVLSLGILIGLAGCGSTIGTFDGLPEGADVTEAVWPRLVDTPAPPEARLTSGAGERATARLTTQRAEANARAVQAGSVAPVSDALTARGQSNLSRTSDAVPGFDEVDLRVRAARLRARTTEAAAPVDDDALQARAALVRQRTAQPIPATPLTTVAAPERPVPLRPLEEPVVSDSFEQRAKRARERAAQAGG